MEIKTIKDLRHNLSDLLLEVGINKEFKNNPAYEAAVQHIDGFISSMNIFEPDTRVEVENMKISEGLFNPMVSGFTIDGNKISFRYTRDYEDYTMEIYASKEKPNVFTSIMTHNKLQGYNEQMGRQMKSKTCIQSVVELRDKGSVTMTDYGSVIYNTNKDMGVSDNYTWYDKYDYSKDGIMMALWHKSFGMGPLTESFDSARRESMLYIPKMNTEPGSFMYDKYSYSLLLRRQYLDTANLVIDNPTGNIKRYSGIVPLNQEHGLRDMKLMGGNLTKEVYIPKLTVEQIADMIKRERNPIIQKGLEELAQRRENYSYSSLDDRNFIYEEAPQGNITK